MKKDNKVYLEDMLVSIEAIEEYIADKQEIDLANNPMLRDAMVRRFEVLGEAATRLSKDFAEVNPDFPVRIVVAMRNLLIHDYDTIRIEKLWETIQDDLPDLKKKIEQLL